MYAATGAVAGWVMTVFPFEFSTLSRVECGPVPRVDREGRAQVYCAVSSVKVRVLKSKVKKQRQKM